MAWLNMKDYAAHRGCFPRAVEAAIQAGRIQRDARGLINVEQADIDWAANTDPHKSAAGKLKGQRSQAIRRAIQGQPEPKGKTLAEVFGEEADRNSASLNQNPLPSEPSNALRQPNPDIGIYAKARAEREHYAAQTARLTYEQRQGLLLPRDRIESVATEWHRILRDMVLAIPDRLPELSAEDRKRLEEELHNLFERDCKFDNLMKSLCGDVKYG